MRREPNFAIPSLPVIGPSVFGEANYSLLTAPSRMRVWLMIFRSTLLQCHQTKIRCHWVGLLQTSLAHKRIFIRPHPRTRLYEQ